MPAEGSHEWRVKAGLGKTEGIDERIEMGSLRADDTEILHFRLFTLQDLEERHRNVHFYNFFCPF